MSISTKQRQVKDVMSTDVVSLNPGDTLHEALDQIVANRVSALPVVDRRGRCVGLLSTSDVIDLTHDLDDDLQQLEEADRLANGWIVDRLRGAFGHETVDSVMTEKVAAVTPETSLPLAAREMLRHRVHRLPVVDGNEQLVGIVSTMDLLAVVAEGAAE
jgi:CBS domain-containing protein